MLGEVFLLNLETVVGRARVYDAKVGWQGCSRGFGQHADRLRNDPRVQTRVRPARGRTTQATSC